MRSKILFRETRDEIHEPTKGSDSLIVSVIGILLSFIHLVLINIAFLFLQAGEAPIHVAARYGHNTVIDYLCSVDADVNLQDKVRINTISI